MPESVVYCIKMNDMKQGTRVSHQHNPMKVGTVVEDIHPKAPVYGQVRVTWDDNKSTSKMHKFSLKVVRTNWLL